MKLTWTIEAADRRAVSALVAATKNDRVVEVRWQRNVNGRVPVFNREEAWRIVIGCLLTTQQRSGLNAPIRKVFDAEPFPLSLRKLKKLDRETVPQLVESTIRKAGRIRRGPTIAREVARNLGALEDDGHWTTVETEFSKLLQLRQQDPNPLHAAQERSSAEMIDRLLWGFGPKQSRNFWQWLGLTRYEIPLDSRVVAWMNAIFLSLTRFRGHQDYAAFLA